MKGPSYLAEVASGTSARPPVISVYPVAMAPMIANNATET